MSGVMPWTICSQQYLFTLLQQTCRSSLPNFVWPHPGTWTSFTHLWFSQVLKFLRLQMHLLRMHLLFARALYTPMTPPRHVSIGIDPTQAIGQLQRIAHFQSSEGIVATWQLGLGAVLQACSRSKSSTYPD